jgi:hypothetical protein
MSHNPGESIFSNIKLTAAQEDLVENGKEYYGKFGWHAAPATIDQLEGIIDEAIRGKGSPNSVAELRSLLRLVLAAHPDRNDQSKKSAALLTATDPSPNFQKLLGVSNTEVLIIEYPAIGRTLVLPGTLLTFEDRYRPKFSKEEVYGRMDPIVSYQNTGRSITIGWEINFADGDIEWAYAALNDLAKMMYPVYHEANFDRPGTGTLVAAPLLRFSLKSPSGGKPGILRGADLSGILGAVDTFDFMKMKGDKGDFNMIRQPGAGLAGVILPINLMVTFSFTVLHEGAKMGWVWSKTDAGNDALTFGQGSGYPYHMGTTIKSQAPGVSTAAALSQTVNNDLRIAAATELITGNPSPDDDPAPVPAPADPPPG